MLNVLIFFNLLSYNISTYFIFCLLIQVCTPEEQREINAKTRSSAKLMESLMERTRPKGWEAAVSHRNKLLEYDRTR